LVRKPDWLKKRINLNNLNISRVRNLICSLQLNTVCQSAKCPNILECFSKKTATFMLMGDVCTRNCGFCGIKTGVPKAPDQEEPYRVARAVREAELKYVVITSVTRDDLSDGGSSHFAKTVIEIRKLNPGIRIECLIPDFKGDIRNLEVLVKQHPDVLSHNMETVKRNYAKARKEADYKVSLNILKSAKSIKTYIYTKSGFMLGLGETRKEIIQLLSDLKKAGCDIVTMGQYLKPSGSNLSVEKYYRPEEFEDLKKLAESFNFKAVMSGVFVRSSYGAEAIMKKILEEKEVCNQLK